MIREYFKGARGGRAALLFAGVAVLLAQGRVWSEVVLDGKFGQNGAVNGPNYTIPAELGSQRGNNLFHSFSRFNIETGASATFTGPRSVQTILARVTGGSASLIEGTLRSEIPGANLFLLNPSGIVFGPGAAVDVSGSFAASTANYLGLADGARFVAALDADDSLLSSAPAAAFGFLNDHPADISLSKSTIAVPEGRVISLLAGNLYVEGSQVSAPGGQVRMGAVLQAGELAANAGLTDLPRGEIVLRNGSSVDANGEGGGRVIIRGGKLIVEDSKIESNTLGLRPGQGIDIAMADSIEILRGGQINSQSPDALARGGAIALEAPFIRLDGGGLKDDFDQPLTQISASSGNLFSEGAAQGGDITVRAGRLELANSARISSDSFGAGDAGSIDIQAGSIRLEGGEEITTQISTDSLGFQGGKGGNMTIRAGSIDLVKNANISSWTVGAAPAGVIDIEADSLNVLSGAYIGTPTLGEGQAGDIRIAARQFKIEGEDSGIVAFTFPGDAPAAGGNVRIESEHFEIDRGFIVTSSFGAGQGGNIDITTRTLALHDGAAINAAGFDEGKAGAITVHAAEALVLRGGSSINTSAPESSGGNITIAAGSASLFGSEMNALAGLNGGSVSIASPSLVYLFQSTVTGQADASEAGFGNGGNITFDAGQLVLNESQLISKSSFGNGGNISILGGAFFQSRSTIDASAPFGLPGSVQVTAPELDLSGVLAGLPLNLLDATTLLQPDCGVRLGGNISSFIVLGRGGLPLAPGGFAPSPVWRRAPDEHDSEAPEEKPQN